MNRLQMKKWIQRKGNTENKVDAKSVSREEMHTGRKYRMDNVLLHTGKDDWETPEAFFRQLDQEFHFTPRSLLQL